MEWFSETDNGNDLPETLEGDLPKKAWRPLGVRAPWGEKYSGEANDRAAAPSTVNCTHNSMLQWYVKRNVVSVRWPT